MFDSLIAPSFLAADFARLGDDVSRAEIAGADWLPLVIMDGNCVPNISFGTAVVATMRLWTKLPLGVHLVVSRSADFILSLKKSEATGIRAQRWSRRPRGKLPHNILYQLLVMKHFYNRAAS